ncbi:MAG: SCO1664 family protein [Jiangellaceae bacterium]|nr:SCO1664 family protein [Jiangellaceae bacterium]
MDERVAALLRAAELAVEGRLAGASNATVRCRLVGPSIPAELRCVYKPVAGERALWDFPEGTLAARELAAYLVSEAVGWRLVPPTVLRDGPFGPGMCQLWVDHDGASLVRIVRPDAVPPEWLPVRNAVDGSGRWVVLVHADDVRLRRMALFDIVVNNADRKGGHVLDSAGHLYGVDHGVCFHVEPKLRTVLWGWTGQPLQQAEQQALRELREQLAGRLGTTLRSVLRAEEVTAAATRVDELLRTGQFPGPAEGWPSFPWPAI